MGNGYFAILYPQDGHMPQLSVTAPVMVKKVVIKVKVWLALPTIQPSKGCYSYFCIIYTIPLLQGTVPVNKYKLD